MQLAFAWVEPQCYWYNNAILYATVSAGEHRPKTSKSLLYILFEWLVSVLRYRLKPRYDRRVYYRYCTVSRILDKFPWRHCWARPPNKISLARRSFTTTKSSQIQQAAPCVKDEDVFHIHDNQAVPDRNIHHTVIWELSVWRPIDKQGEQPIREQEYHERPINPLSC